MASQIRQYLASAEVFNPDLDRWEAGLLEFKVQASNGIYSACGLGFGVLSAGMFEVWEL